MKGISAHGSRWWAAGLVFISLLGCTPQAEKSEFFGKVQPPDRQILRYISGSEPESLDPQIGTSQPEARVYMSLFEGLVEYHPKTSTPIPEIAESWEINSDSSEFTFHLRKNAKWSNGDPLNAHDFVYTFRRGVAPELAARNAYLAYEIKYAQAYNEGGNFVRDPKMGEFLLARDFEDAGEPVAMSRPLTPVLSPGGGEGEKRANALSRDTPFHRYISGPDLLVVAGDPKELQKELNAKPKLKAAVEGKELVPVKAEDIGVEAVDEHTLRLTLTQPAPYFLGLLPHQFFRAVPRKAIEKHGNLGWTQPRNIVTCGPFKLAEWKPYNEIVVKRDPLYWDAATVKLEEIHFYALEEQTTMQNLYKAGRVDATYNHTVPVGWLDQIRRLKDYMDAPEVAIEYYLCNTKRPPMNDVRVRKALNMAIDKVALAKFRKVVKPLTAFSPEGIFPGYPQPSGDPFNPERARQLLAEAGFADASGKYDPSKFPIEEVDLSYNTAESNRQMAEFIQAQWKQNLGLTMPLKNMEFKTFLQVRAKLEYKGVARAGWVGDYMDPFTFLALFSTEGGENGTGWFDAKYVAMLKEANRQSDPQKRYTMLAQAEAYMLEAQPVLPLLTQATNWMKKPYVKGLYPNPQTLHAWKFVYIEYDPAKWDRGVPNMMPDPPLDTKTVRM
jgi:oligopeptide transport system substrate-binding protein